MTAFFDKKQDVIDIQLTKYGEYLLSLGKFNPVYYSFFDNGVIYDTRYAAFSSSQGDNEGRIQDTTPAMRTQHSFEGRAEQVLRYNQYVSNNFRLREDQKVRFPSTVDKHFTALSEPLGNSDLSSDVAPAWNMRFFHNKMLNWSTAYTGSQVSKRIPQIESAITYETRVRSTDQKPPTESSEPVFDEDGFIVPGGIYQPVESDPVLQEGIFADGTFIEVKPDHILLELKEKNTEFMMENFDIEVYEIKEETLKSGEIRDELIPLKFKKREQPIVNGILVDSVPDNTELDPSYVEYYFDIFVDSEIDELTICQSLQQLKAEGILVDTEYNCPDIPSYSSRANTYSDGQNIESTKCEIDSPAGSGNPLGVD